MGQGGCCNEPNFFNSHTALVQLSGALVGGPDNADNFPDRRPDYQRSEVVSLLQHLQLEATVMSSKQYSLIACSQKHDGVMPLMLSWRCISRFLCAEL